MLPARSFDSDKHPRDWGGRFAGSVGQASAVHAAQVARAGNRPDPGPGRRQHAIVPHITGNFGRAITIKPGATQGVGD